MIRPQQVYNAVCAGNFQLSKEKSDQLVPRKAPLKELKGIIQCTGIEKSYFIVTGSTAI